jgi:predicted N-acetyltransferase YhbS
MITYRSATPSDNQQLLELTSGAGMDGEIALRIDRHPDFFRLLKLRGESKAFVAVDNGTIIGSVCVSLQQKFVGGEIFPVQYIGDLKVATSYRNNGIGLQLCNEAANYVLTKGTDLVFLTVSKGNTKPFAFFKNRPHIPDFESVGSFNIHQFVGKKRKAFHPAYTLEATSSTEELIQFLNSNSSKYQLGSVITAEKLEDIGSFVVRQNKKIIAAICLIDTMQFKQNVVTRLSPKLKYLLSGINSIYKISGISRMPLVNQPVRMIYIKYLAANSGEKELVRLMINHARNIAYDKSYSFVSFGLHEKDPMNKYFSGMLKLTFNSVGMLLSVKNNKQLVEAVKTGIPFEDYSLV